MCRFFLSITIQVRKVIDMLVNNFVLSQNPNAKKGGLIGVAAAAIALGKDIGLFVSEIVSFCSA